MSPPVLFDRPRLRARLARAARAPDAPARFHPLSRRVAADLAERLSVVLRRFPAALDASALDLGAASVLEASGTCERVWTLRSDASGEADVAGDLEALPFGDETLDLAVSLLSLQAVDDLPGALVQMRRALRPDGLFMAALLGGETLRELRAALAEAEAEVTGGASPRVAPFMDVRALGGLLQRAGLALPVVDLDAVTIRYPDAFALMADLRAVGAANPLADRLRRPTPRAVLVRAAAIYAERFADADGRVRATFEILWASGWAPHESQQKPLRPGSARMSLADALGAKEGSS